MLRVGKRPQIDSGPVTTNSGIRSVLTINARLVDGMRRRVVALLARPTNPTLEVRGFALERFGVVESVAE
jgi:hypothetical protein